jgi:hypothetical protein
LFDRLLGRSRRHCQAQHSSADTVSLAALTSISTNDLLQHIRVLIRRVRRSRSGLAGEELTVNYLVNQFKKLGLKPGNPDGIYSKPASDGFTGHPLIV